jgi:lysozyme
MSIVRKRLTLLATTTAVAMIAGYEGYREYAYEPVPGDKTTIGYGQTYYADGSTVKAGDKITRQEAFEQLTLLTKRDVVDKLATCVKVPISQNEYDAYVSLAYNIGQSAFCGSTLVKKLNQYDYVGACQQILRWDKYKGKTLKGLSNRRLKEYKTCMWGAV